MSVRSEPAVPGSVETCPFSVTQGELTVGGIRLSQLAARVGRTPFYAYDRSVLIRHVKGLRETLPPAISLHYAMKANPMPALVQTMVGLVDGLDLASAGELKVALDAGAKPETMSFAGPGKRTEELWQAVAAGVTINVESSREIPDIVSAGEALGVRPRLAIRVNPDFELKASGMKMSGGPKQFGIDAEIVPDVLTQLRNLDVEFVGFHVYSGSQNLQHDAICDAQQKTLALAIRLADHAPGPIKMLNMGGGFGVPYFPNDRPLDISPIADNLAELARIAEDKLPGAELVIELGRYLVAHSGIYVARVIDRKASRGQVFLVTDGGLHHHLAASGNFGQIIRKNYPIVSGLRMGIPEREKVSVVGPLCTPLDILGDGVELPETREGDLVCVLMSGAYGYTASPHRFLSHPDPLEVLV